jgi:hypothetical protein
VYKLACCLSYYEVLWMLCRGDGIAVTDVSWFVWTGTQPAILVQTAGCSVGLCTLNVSTLWLSPPVRPTLFKASEIQNMGHWGSAHVHS